MLIVSVVVIHAHMRWCWWLWVVACYECVDVCGGSYMFVMVVLYGGGVM